MMAVMTMLMMMAVTLMMMMGMDEGDGGDDADDDDGDDGDGDRDAGTECEGDRRGCARRSRHAHPVLQGGCPERWHLLLRSKAMNDGDAHERFPLCHVLDRSDEERGWLGDAI